MNAPMKDPQAGGETPARAPERKRTGARRIAMMLSVPLVVLLIGVYLWLSAGRYIETDNAYVQQARVSISPDVPGRIVSVSVSENDSVQAGDPLFTIDPAPYELALRQAEAAVAGARLEVEQLRAAYGKAMTEADASKETLEIRKADYERQQSLAEKGFTAQSRLDTAQLALQEAQERAAVSQKALASARAALGNDPDIVTDNHPRVAQALAQRDKAALDLERTGMRAPASGIVSQVERLQIGQHVAVGTTVMSLVAGGTTWVEANYKETQLTHVRPGQRAEIVLDAYPGEVIAGRVESIGAATGAEFSILPAQNATGNWVKVVQRIPVRVRIDESQRDLVPRLGMSATVTIDTERARLFIDLVTSPFSPASGKTAAAGR